MTRILIADDEDGIRGVIKDMLEGQGYEFEESSDGASAYLMAVSETLDIIILDLTMPVMSGFEVLRKLKENPDTKAIPVLIVTGRRLPKYETEAWGLGAVDFITKPFGKDELRDRVKLALSQ